MLETFVTGAIAAGLGCIFGWIARSSIAAKPQLAELTQNTRIIPVLASDAIQVVELAQDAR